MQAYWTLVRRELATYFVSLIGYVLIAAVLFLLGICFCLTLNALNREPLEMPITELFYDTMFFWLILLLVTPVITMRSFAHEKFSGTFETLMTTPVGDWQVVLAKFTGAFVFYALTWLPLLGCLYALRRYTNDSGAMDLGPVGGTFLGILLLGGLYISIGCFASSLTRSQIIAAMISFAIGITLFLMSFAAMGAPTLASWQVRALDQVSMLAHMRDFVRGVVDTRHVTFYLSGTAFFLYLTHKVVESRRWK